jgi:hypothetical protein
MPENLAPDEWRAQGAVLDAFAEENGADISLSELLNENILREKGVAFQNDQPIPHGARVWHMGVPNLSVPRHVLERRDERGVGDSGKIFNIMILQPIRALWHDEAIS